ncbi:MAG TPA: hypothetical protein VGK50_00240 [Coriobacteriia bacterium]
MAITRRQFVATFGALAAAAGIGQADIAKLTEAFAYGNFGGAGVKPTVYWVHGAECTGCSTSLLGLFENLSGKAFDGLNPVPATTVLDAVGLMGTGPGGGVGRTLPALNVDPVAATTLNIADVVVDVINLKYHETIMGPGGDSAYKILNDARTLGDGTFVLVVEGAVQDNSTAADTGGYWNKPGHAGSAAWCSIAMDGTAGADVELKFDDVVKGLAAHAAGIVAIGQCATFGGYPACIGSGLDPLGNGATTKKQTPAFGVSEFLTRVGQTTDAAKVVNVPGCPANPWWFVLSVVMWLVDANAILGGGAGPLGVLGPGVAGALTPQAAAVDSTGRLKNVFGMLNHGKYCPRYTYYANGQFASKPGGVGCLKNIGCKGLYTMALCTRHGWNGQQPQNLAVAPLQSPAEAAMLAYTTPVTCGGNCLTAGAPCMGCTEKGYPDAFVPFISKR